ANGHGFSVDSKGHCADYFDHEALQRQCDTFQTTLAFGRKSHVSQITYWPPDHCAVWRDRIVGALLPSARADISKGPCAVTKLIDVPAKMRDGVTLLADVYRRIEAGSYPVILMRLPYDKSIAQTYVYAPPEFYASHCYIVVIQDVRGQYASQGTFYPFRDEMNDGYDSVEWAAALPGSSGKGGMYGFSYVGAPEWVAAVMQPPHLAAVVPGMTSSDYYDGWSYEGGAWSLAFEESWPIFTIAMVNARRTGDQSSVAKILDAASKIAQTYNHL